MELRNGEYKIENDGIWIPKKVLEEWRDHYFNVSDKNKKKWVKEGNGFAFPYYLGKATVLVDLLKMFEPLEGE